MSAQVFYRGDEELAVLTNVFSVSDVPTDPDAVTLTVVDPDGVSTTYTYPATLTRDSAGAYRKNVACTVDGTWQYVWIGTGAASDVMPGTWRVEQVDLQRLYCTESEYKSRARIEDALDDSDIIQALNTSSRGVDDVTNRFFYQEVATRRIEIFRSYELVIPDLVELVSLKTDEDGDGIAETTWSASDFELWRDSMIPRVEEWPYTEIRAIGSRCFPRSYGWGRTPYAEIEGTWGWLRNPEGVKQASAIVAADLRKLADAPFGIAGMSQFGGMRVRANGVAMGLIAPYIRHRVLIG